MTRPLPEIESQLSAALEAVTSELGHLEGRWPGLVGEYADGGLAVPRAEAHVRLGDDFAGHPLFRTYEALGAALDALRHHNSVPGWYAGKAETGAEAGGEAAAAGGASTISVSPTTSLSPTSPVTPTASFTPTSPVTPTASFTPTPDPSPQGGGESAAAEPQQESAAAEPRGGGASLAAAARSTGNAGGEEPLPASDMDEASVVIVGRGGATARRSEATPRDVLAAPSPGSRSLRERLGAVLGEAGAGPGVTARSLRERIGSVLAGSPEPPAAPVERPDRRTTGLSVGARTSRLAAPPARRGGGLWRDEASVVIVRGPAERRDGGGEPAARAPGIPDADGDR